ncbi:MAG: NAD(P)H-dependent glycerol-3-phosphate dehydrogenase, partial [Burkholderiaceae bacterium]
NERYLPGVVLSERLTLAHMPAGSGGPVAETLQSVWEACDLVVLATPMAALRSLLQQLVSCPVPVAWLCKGFEPDGREGSGAGLGLMAHEVLAQAAPGLRAGVLSGPSFALEVARGQPTALVAASADAAVRECLVRAFHGASLRVYGGEDMIGVEVGGAVKNVLAIATGLCDGMHLGLNARAALITRGLNEMSRFGVALGARPETFMGLSGLGDLVLTATGDLSRNRKVGLVLASGQSLHQAVAGLGHVAEGVYCARTVLERAQGLGLAMPICAAVVALLDRQLDPRQAVSALMARGARNE